MNRSKIKRNATPRLAEVMQLFFSPNTWQRMIKSVVGLLHLITSHHLSLDGADDPNLLTESMEEVG